MSKLLGKNLRDTAFIELYDGTKVLVDKEDFEYLNQWTWRLSAKGYTYRMEYIKGSGRKNQKNHYYSMSRVIMNAPQGVDVDHINGNPLDNRRSNLRLCTHAENQRNMRVPSHNTSGYKGVVYVKSGKRIKRWVARLIINQKQINLGLYLTKEEAALAYNEAAKQHFGEFAKLNEVRS